MKSINQKIIAILCVLVIGSCLATGYMSLNTSSTARTKNTNIELQLLAKQGAARVDAELESEWSILEALASDESIADPSVPMSEKVRLLHSQIEKYGAIDISIADLKGNAVKPDGVSFTSIAERQYFKDAIAGKRAVSDPIENATAPGTLIITFAVPIRWNNEIVGVIFKVGDGNCLSEITNTLTFGKTGKSYMLNAEGTAVAHYNKDMVLTQDNARKNLAKDPSLKDLIRVQDVMLSGVNG